MWTLANGGVYFVVLYDVGGVCARVDGCLGL